MRILVTGATGLIGRSLSEALTREGHEVIALSRNPRSAGAIAAAEVHAWDTDAGPPPDAALKGVESVVHLAGEPVTARRWSDAQKKRIRDSRVLTTRNLVSGLASMAKRPASLISSSAVGYYGDRGDEPLDEDSSPGRGFLCEVCREWEGEAEEAGALSVRVVKIRTGIVLSGEGGALAKMLPAFKLGVAGRLGSGRQWFPWIHIDDIVGMIGHAIFSSSLDGAVNGVAPGVITNAEFTKQLSQLLHRPALLPVPEFALRLLIREMAEVLLGSQRAMAKAALDSGYKFKHPQIRPALEDLLVGARKAERARG